MSTANPWQGSARTARVLRRTPLAWDVDPGELDARDRTDETRFPDLVGVALLAFPVLERAGVPANELGGILLALVGLTRRPVPGPALRLAAWPAVITAYLAATSVAQGVIEPKRLVHLAVWALLCYLITVGRLHLPSMARGATLGIVLSVGLSLAGLAPLGYTGRLSGFFGDPNSGGFTVLVVGLAALATGPSRRIRMILLPLMAGVVLFTFSRTTLLALAFTALWLLAGRRFGRVTGIGLVGLMVYLTSNIPRELRLFGPFSDRTGSDALRGRLIVQEHADVSQHPWFGAGAGTARLMLDQNVFFYHSSYLALEREGGRIATVLLLGMVLVLALQLLGQPPALRNLWAECAVIAVMVCAINVGEVLLDLPAALAFGVAFQHLRRSAPTSGAPPRAPAGVHPRARR